MEINRVAWTVLAFLMFCLISCTANLEANKNRAIAIRELGEA